MVPSDQTLTDIRDEGTLTAQLFDAPCESRPFAIPLFVAQGVLAVREMWTKPADISQVRSRRNGVRTGAQCSGMRG